MTESAVLERVKRKISLEFELDLPKSKRAERPIEKVADGYQQRMTRFEGRRGDQEVFSISLVIPEFPFEDGSRPTQKQTDALLDFYGTGSCEYAYQAGAMLDARGYAREIAKMRQLKAFPELLFAISTAAYILSFASLRRDCADWSKRARYAGLHPDRAAPRLLHACRRFGDRFILDMQGNGSVNFGCLRQRKSGR